MKEFVHIDEFIRNKVENWQVDLSKQNLHWSFVQTNLNRQYLTFFKKIIVLLGTITVSIIAFLLMNASTSNNKNENDPSVRNLSIRKTLIVPNNKSSSILLLTTTKKDSGDITGSNEETSIVQLQLNIDSSAQQLFKKPSDSNGLQKTIPIVPAKPMDSLRNKKNLLKATYDSLFIFW